MTSVRKKCSTGSSDLKDTDKIYELILNKLF